MSDSLGREGRENPGNVLRRLRESRNLSRRTLAEKIRTMFPDEFGKTHEQTLIRLENGSRRFSDHWARPLAAALGVEMAVFFSGGPSPVGTPRQAAFNLGHDNHLTEELCSVGATTEPQSADGRELDAGNISELRLDGEDINRVAPKGCVTIVDWRDTIPMPGRIYLVRLDGVVVPRRFGSNPERWEPVSYQEIPVYYPFKPIEVLGRIIRAIIEL